MEILDLIVEYGDDVLAILGALGVVAGLVARLTPNKTDDAIVARVVGFLDRLSSLFLKPKAK